MTVTYHDESKKSRRMLGRVKSESHDEFPQQTYTQNPPIYEMLENLQRGILPHNDEILTWLSSIRTSGVISSGGGLSDAGQRLMRDVGELVILIEKAVQTKNRDELFQRFLYHARLAARIAADDMRRAGKIMISKKAGGRVYLGGSKEQKIQQEFKTARRRIKTNVGSLYNVLRLLITSRNTGDVINDVQGLSVKALSSVRQEPTLVMPILTESPYAVSAQFPVQEQTRTNIDDLRRKVAQTSQELERLKVNVDKAPPYSPDPASMSKPEPSLTPLSSNIQPMEFEKAETLPIVNRQEKITDISLGTPTRVPTPVSLKKLAEKEVRPEVQAKDPIEDLIDDLKRLLIKVNSSPDFKLAFTEVYRFFIGLQQVSTSGREPIVPRELRHEANFQQAQLDLLRILERFAGSTSLDPTIRVFQNIRGEAMRDYKLKDFIGDWTSYLTRSITDPDYIEHEEFRHRGRFLFERTREFHNEKYRPMFDEAFNSLHGFLEGWSKDELTIQIGQCLNKIFTRDLIRQPDVSDKAPGLLILNVIKPDLFNDFRNVILPNVLRQLHEVPILRIEAVYGRSKLVLNNLILPVDAFLPMDFEMKAKTSLKLQPKSKILGRSSVGDSSKGWKNGLVMHVSNIKTHVRDVHFTMDHQESFPKMKDSGLADIQIGGHKGLNITIYILSDARDRVLRQEKRPKLSPHYVRVSIDSLRLCLHNSSHDTAYKMLSPMINYRVKKAIETAIKDRIVSAVFLMDDLIRKVAKQH